MTRPGNTHGSEHPVDLLLPYVENLLAAEDHARVEQHLASCPECSREVQDLDRMIVSLKKNKEVFCPEPWLLHQFFESGEDPEGTIADHVRTCPQCREDLSEYRSCRESASMPGPIRQVFERNYATKASPTVPHPGRSIFLTVREYLASVFRAPLPVLGTVAALVLLVVLIYPREAVPPVVGLSSVTWEDAYAGKRPLTPKGIRLMGPKPAAKPRPRVAAILVFKGFDQTPAQEEIDSLYTAFSPDRSTKQRLELVPPSQVKQSLEKESAVRADAHYLADTLGKRLDLSAMVILTLTVKRDTFEVQGELIDVVTRKALVKTMRTHPTQKDLPSTVGAAAADLLKSAGSLR